MTLISCLQLQLEFLPQNSLESYKSEVIRGQFLVKSKSVIDASLLMLRYVHIMNHSSYLTSQVFIFALQTAIQFYVQVARLHATLASSC